ncbi:GNAT family N-acetyltransferase [Patescibacteria group bacterium]|nr:GNAT family N-acetyltransferase [Patescibacteria group bacterium]MBU4162272.1 GNAT family N-acetyltransferase [Patescibacteria group bacterium]
MEFFVEKFDSEVLGKTVAKLILDEPISKRFQDKYKEFVAGNNPDIVFAFTHFYQQNINFLEEQEFGLISVRTIYKCPDLTSKKPNNDPDLSIKEKVDCRLTPDNDSVQEILKIIARTSRYCKDIKLGEESCFKIYNQWLVNSFSGYAKKIFFLFYKEVVIGFVTLKEKDDKVWVDLIGIGAGLQGKGLGDLLIDKCKQYCQENKKELWVITEGENIGASRFYQKNGFLIQILELVFHKHLNKSL